MSESWDDYADGWDKNNSVVAYSEKAFQSLTNTLSIDGFRVLDFGCGTGLLTEKLSHHGSSIVVLDPSSKMISTLEAKNIRNVHVIPSELTQEVINKHKLLGTKFDLIVASSALAFVPDFHSTLQLLKQLLRNDGLLVQWDWLKDESESGSGFSENEIKDAYEKAGLSKYAISIPFSMDNDGGSTKVVMVVAIND